MPASIACLHGALELGLVDPAIGAADLPAAEPDRRDLELGSPELPVFHAHPRPFYCAAMAEGGGAKRRSMSRRTRTAALSGTATSAQRDDLAGGDVAQQRHLVRQADRQRALGEAALGRHQLAPHRVAALAVERLAGAQIALGDRHDVAAQAAAAGRSARRAAPPTAPTCRVPARSGGRACTSRRTSRSDRS